MELEPNIQALQDGHRVDCVVEVLFTGPGYSVLTTKIHKVTSLTDVKLTKGQSFTLFGMSKWQVANQLWLMNTEHTVVLQHLPRDVSELNSSGSEDQSRTDQRAPWSLPPTGRPRIGTAIAKSNQHDK